MPISKSFYPINITLLANRMKIEDIGLGRSGLDYPSVPCLNTGAFKSIILVKLERVQETLGRVGLLLFSLAFKMEEGARSHRKPPRTRKHFFLQFPEAAPF